MIVPSSWLRGSCESIEHEAHEWAEDIKLLGYMDDYDGSDRPGLPAAIAEDLPSNETPVQRRWDMPWEMAEQIAPECPAYWFFGPSTYVLAERAANRGAAPRN